MAPVLPRSDTFRIAKEVTYFPMMLAAPINCGSELKCQLTRWIEICYSECEKILSVTGTFAELTQKFTLNTCR